ncbi:MAG: hypothetical protein M1570_06850 [Chloroflexi bacterium]|nr:hypothetical protein [Chloroflexota bacterium]
MDNDTIEHPALGQTPRDAYQRGLAETGARSHRQIADDLEFQMWTLPTTAKGTAKVAPGRGVKINHIYYWARNPPPSISDLARRLHFARGERLYQIDRAKAKTLAVRHREAIRALQPRPSRVPRKRAPSEMKRILEDSLTREYPVPLSDIAAQNGYANAGWIRLEFSDLCRAIGQKIAELKKTEMGGKGKILKAALEKDPPLTVKQMAGRLGLGCPGILRRRFPAQYEVLLTKRRTYEEAKRSQLRSDLIKALAESPAPAVPDICRRLGISTSWVYCLHGDLARAIAARHLKERRECMKRRRELLRIEVFAIVKDMLDRGERPVQSGVQKLLSADSLKARRALGRCLNEATRNLMNTQTEEVR